jgi:UDP-GlcNAc:undecaprenyl-phosphate GlcNAc-1-phosphate transferase
MRSYRSLALVLAASTLVTFLLTPLAIRLARKVGAVVPPGDRRVHTSPTPTLGGLAMFGGLLAGVAVAATRTSFDAVFESRTTIAGVLGAAFVIFVSGFVDDIREVSAPAKLAGMILAGSVLTLAGTTIVNVPVPFVGFTVLAPDLAAVASVAWVVVMANAANLIDGLDGLAAGIVAIAAGSFLIYSIKLDHVGALDPANAGPLIAVIVVGVCLGFLPWNFHPAKVFMGDSGALLLGLLMAASTIAVGGQSDDSFTGQSWFFFAPLVIPLVILGVPLFDMLFAVLRRTTRRRGFATADKDHLHHRLLRLGHSHRQSVLILWGFTGVLSAFALVPVLTRKGVGLWPILAVGVALLLFTMLMPRVNRRRQAETMRRNGDSGSAAAAEHGPAGSGATDPVELREAASRR